MKAKTSTGTISVIFGYKLTSELLLVRNFPSNIKFNELKNQNYQKRLINKKYNHKIKYYR